MDPLTAAAAAAATAAVTAAVTAEGSTTAAAEILCDRSGAVRQRNLSLTNVEKI